MTERGSPSERRDETQHTYLLPRHLPCFGAARWRFRWHQMPLKTRHLLSVLLFSSKIDNIAYAAISVKICQNAIVPKGYVPKASVP
jgi:hypothetical protein